MVTVSTILENSLSKVDGHLTSINAGVKWEGGSGGMRVDNPMPKFHILLLGRNWVACLSTLKINK